MNTKYKKSIILVAAVISLSTVPCKTATAQVTFSEQEWVLPTWLPGPPDKNPVFFRGESYQGASKVVYPYPLMDVISSERKDHPWKALYLENEYIRLCITPEIGGKLYFATDKTNGYNFIYKNNVVKPSNIGMLGAWVSGGIEWCVLHHHRASTFLPVDWDHRENPDGSKTIIIGETEPRHRMRWTIAVTAFPGRSYFEAEVRIINPTPFTHSFLYWANVAAHTNKDYQVIFPPSVNTATFHAKNSFTRWPFSTEVFAGQDYTRGVDVSWWINSPGSNSFFAWDLKEDFMGGYDHGRETGTVHIGDHNIVKGAKLWEWGSGPRGQATEARLTENDGPYVEIMTGAFSDNQPDYSWIGPYEVKSFKQYWYPVKDIEGFKNANLDGALNLEKRDGKNVFFGFLPTRKFDSLKVTIQKGGKILYEKVLSASPSDAVTRVIKTGEEITETELFAEITDLETGEVIISYRPAETKPPENLPETVRRPPEPAEIKTVEELFLTGSRIQQFYNPTLNAMDYYSEALKRDRMDIRTNTAVGRTFLLNGDYLKAREHLARAIKRLTRDYTRPSDCEALYLQGIVLKELGLYDEAVDTLYRASWDFKWHAPACLQLARIFTAKRNYPKALEEVEKSLSSNAVNNSALCLKAALLRKKADFSGAMDLLIPLVQKDPLDFRAQNELYLVYLESAKPDQALSHLEYLNRQMRDFSQNYLELAAGYAGDGLLIEAGEVLRRFTGNDPVIDYWLGWLEEMKGEKEKASGYFSKASSGSTDYVFPFRLETLKALETALKYNPGDSRAYYYMGNILFDRQPEKAIKMWEKAVGYDPLFAIAHRNLGWAYYRHSGDGQKAVSSYEKAIALRKDEPIYYEELDALYEMSNSPVEKRYRLFEGNNETVSRRDDAFARQIEVLTLAGRPELAVEYLKGRNFSYREGSSRVRDIIIDAHLMMGIKLMKEKKHREALDNFILAHVPEEEASGGRTGNRNIQADYFTGIAWEALGDKRKAKASFEKSASIPLRGVSYISYYKGLSQLKLGRTKEADDTFRAMIEEGTAITGRKTGEADFFTKFGEQEAENARLSNGYLILGLGYKGAGSYQKAREALKKSAGLSAGNLYALYEYSNMQ